MPLKIEVKPIAPSDFVRTRSWEIFVQLIEALVEARDEVKANPFVAQHARASAGAALSIAMELYLAESIQKESGQYREQLEPLIAQFRAAHVETLKQLNEQSRDLQ